LEVQEEKLLSLRLLGPPEAGFEERSVRFGIQKTLAFLCYLAAEGGGIQGGSSPSFCGPKARSGAARTCALSWPG
jgi:hypothetical protein